MQIPLSRVEYDYVIETFLQELPPLLLQSGVLFSLIPSGSYTIKNSRLYFKPIPSFIGKKVSVFFEHKKRSIVFHTAVCEKDAHCYAALPDRAYKYDPPVQKGSACAEVHLSDESAVVAYEHEDFPLNSIIHENLNIPTFTDFLPSAYQTAANYAAEDALKTDMFPLFFYRLYEFEKRLSFVLDLRLPSAAHMLFVDSKILICACGDNIALSLRKRNDFQFVLRFPHRIIKCNGHSLFSHFLPKSKSAFIGFFFEDMFEEDKRFLYEHVYHEKYNPSSLCLKKGVDISNSDR